MELLTLEKIVTFSQKMLKHYKWTYFIIDFLSVQNIFFNCGTPKYVEPFNK
jgi:hypothetical protein